MNVFDKNDYNNKSKGERRERNSVVAAERQRGGGYGDVEVVTEEVKMQPRE